MELKDFISTTIEQISLGVIEASEKCKEFGVIVNPNITIGSAGDFCLPKHPQTVNIQRRVQLLEMDVAVREEQSTEGTYNGKVGISVVNIGGATVDRNYSSNENRIKFTIPVCLPITDVVNR